MSKHDTQYSETEREITYRHLSNFGLNPYALDLLVASYKRQCAPLPIYFDYHVSIPPTKDGDEWREAMFMVEIKKPGFLGRGKGEPEKLDKGALKLFCRSYFDNCSPYPVDFFFKGVEVHIHTPGVSDQDKKNIARRIYNPTASKKDS